MKGVLIIVGLLVIIFAMSRIINSNGVTSNKGSQSKNISAVEAKKMLDAGVAVILLDVRTPEEYTEGHIPKSLFKEREEELDR